MSAEAARGPLRSVARWKYRVSQFLGGFRTTVEPEQACTIVSLLSAPELHLFLSMRPRDRRHAAETMRRVRLLAAADGRDVADEVLVAALLHDVGKGPLRAEDRIIYVLLCAVSPSRVDALARPEGDRWRVALWRLRHHAAVGASLLETAGSAPRVVELTANHHPAEPPRDDRELRWLRLADEAA